MIATRHPTGFRRGLLGPQVCESLAAVQGKNVKNNGHGQ
jgi:hypothetical protein